MATRTKPRITSRPGPGLIIVEGLSKRPRLWSKVRKPGGLHRKPARGEQRSNQFCILCGQQIPATGPGSFYYRYPIVGNGNTEPYRICGTCGDGK